MSVRADLDTIPYVVWHDIDVLEEGAAGTKMKLGFRPDVLNYVGTMHAGALYTLAETVAGVTADGAAKTVGAFILLRDAQIRYTRRADTDVVASASVDADAMDATRVQFERNARADMSVEVNIADKDDETVFEGTFNYALRPRKK